MSTKTDWIAIARDLGPSFAERAAAHDADDSFVAENYAALKEQGLFSAGVPGGARRRRRLARGAVRRRPRDRAPLRLDRARVLDAHAQRRDAGAESGARGNKAPEPLLRKVAAENLVIATSGGSDWLPGSGKLEKVEGGYRMTGRKIFSSGVPSANLFTTSGHLRRSAERADRVPLRCAAARRGLQDPRHAGACSACAAPARPTSS